MSTPTVPLLDAWERNRSARKSKNLKLWPHHLALLKDPSVVVSLIKQNAKTAGLLPADATVVFRRLMPESLVATEGRVLETQVNANATTGENQLKPFSKLEAGKVLPLIYGDPPPEMLNIPLEELDPYYQAQKTFIVINKGSTIFRFNAEPACHVFSPFSITRQAAIKIFINSLFRMFMMVTILTNCLFMTMSDQPPEWRNIVEYVFIGIYSFEVTIKVLARGLNGRFTFLHDPWNWLDVIILLVAYTNVFLGLSALHALQVLRVLKLCPLFPGLKSSAGALIQSVKKLGGAVVITLPCLAFFSMLGLQLFMGSLRQKCVMSLASIMDADNGTLGFTVDYNNTPESAFDYQAYTVNKDYYYFQPKHIDALLCGNQSDAGVCPEGYICLKAGKNPNYGFTSYDTFGWSFLSVFRLMMHDFWENLYHETLRAAGKIHTIFFMIVIFSTFYLGNLILARVAMVCVDQNDAAIAEAKEKEEEYALILQHLKNQKTERQDKISSSRISLSSQNNKGGGPEDDHTDDKQSYGKDREIKKALRDEEVPRMQERTSTATSATIAVNDTMEDLEELQRSCTPCWYTFADIFLKWNCCPPIKKWMHSVVMNPFFDLSITICIVLNTILLSMEHYPSTESFERFLTFGDLVFTSIFAAEMVFKIIAMDPYFYFQKGWNIFDSILVILSLMDLFLESVQPILCCYSLMRIFRLARFWPTFNLIVSSLITLCKLVTILVLTIFSFAVVGMQLFGKDYSDCVCKIAEDCELPRWHMNDFFHSFLLIFRILCGEWIETMWDCMEVAGPGMCITFYMTVVIIGNLVLLNLFITLLLSSFSGNNLLPLGNDGENNIQIAIKRITNWAKKLVGLKPKMGGGKEEQEDHIKSNNLDLNDLDKSKLELKKVSSKWDDSYGESFPNTLDLHVPIAEGEAYFDSNNDNGTSGHKVEDGQNTKDDAGDSSESCMMNNGPPIKGVMGEKMENSAMPQECCTEHFTRSCPCFALDITQGKGQSWWNFRGTCYAIVENKYFETFILFVILLSSISLVCEDIYLQQRRTLLSIVKCGDYVFTCIFIMEMLLKWVAYGFKVYFTNGWCWMDFLIVAASIIRLMANSLGYAVLGPINLHALKALRPLRALSRFEGMRVVVNTLVGTLPSIFNMLLGCLTLWLFFSILGVNIFAGKFYYCFNETSEELFIAEEVNNKSECYELIFHTNASDVRWKNINVNFDNVGMGYLALFQLATVKGWLDIMYAAVDSFMVENQPVYEADLYKYLYFVIFFIFGSFITLILFTGVFIDYYSKQKTKYGGNDIFMTESQKKYYSTMKKKVSKSVKPIPRPKGNCLGHVFDMVTNKYFDILMMGVIIFNMVVMMTETYDQNELKDYTITLIYFILILIFTIEFILKIIGLRKYYFTVGLNVLDFFVLILSLVGIFFTDILQKYTFTGSGGIIFSILRLARIGRVLSLIDSTKGVRALLFSLKMSLPAVFNMCLFHFVIMFTYSIFGMFSFAYVKPQAMMNDMVNFETFGNSIICLFTITTSAGWDGILFTLMNSDPPDCDPNLENPGSDVRGNCGSTVVGIIFLCSYVIISFLVAINMSVAIILEIFNEATEESTTLLPEAAQAKPEREVTGAQPVHPLRDVHDQPPIQELL